MGIAYNHTPASNTAAVVTIPAVEGVAHEIEAISFSYDTDPDAGAYVQIESPSGTVKQKWWVTSKGPGPIPLGNSCVKCARGEAAIVTLSAGGTGKSGAINVIQRG